MPNFKCNSCKLIKAVNEKKMIMLFDPYNFNLFKSVVCGLCFSKMFNFLGDWSEKPKTLDSFMDSVKHD